MRIHWKELRQYDEKAMEKTIAQCQTLMKHKENWFVSKKTAYRQFAKLEIKRISVVYGFFLLCLLYFLLFSEQMKIGIVLLYYLLLGSYFLYQLYEFKNNDMEELMQALPIHEGKRFILHMCTFLIIHLISFLSTYGHLHVRNHAISLNTFIPGTWLYVVFLKQNQTTLYSFHQLYNIIFVL